MHKHFVVSFLLLAAVPTSWATGIPAYPDDIEEFIDRREICDHYRGEEPYDVERPKFLAEQINKTCSGTDEELRELKNKYKDNKVHYTTWWQWRNFIWGIKDRIVFSGGK